MRTVRYYRNVWGYDNFLYLLSWEMQAYSEEKTPAGIPRGPGRTQLLTVAIHRVGEKFQICS